MCLIDRSGRTGVIRREEDTYAPRPVSNFHGGPAHHHNHSSSSNKAYVRQRSSVPERVGNQQHSKHHRNGSGHEGSHRASTGRVHEVTRISRTYER